MAIWFRAGVGLGRPRLDEGGSTTNVQLFIKHYGTRSRRWCLMMGLDGSKCTCKARDGRYRRMYLSTDRGRVCSSEDLFGGGFIGMTPP